MVILMEETDECYYHVFERNTETVNASMQLLHLVKKKKNPISYNFKHFLY